MPSVRRDRRMASGGRVQVARHQGQVGRFDRHVGAGADRQAEIGLSQGRRVVHAVPHHRDDPALLLQPLDHDGLVGRQHLGDHLVDPHLGGHGLGRSAVVAGQQHRRQPQLAQPPRRRRRSSASGCRRSRTPPSTAPSQPATIAVRPSASAASRAASSSGAPAKPASASSSGRPTTSARPVDGALGAEALTVDEALDRRQRAELGLGPRRRWRERSGARRPPRARRPGAAPRFDRPRRPRAPRSGSCARW